MKKNKAMRLGSAVLVLALLTSCAICSTFAKYTTTADGEDSARVAYWGFGTDTDNTFALFANTYDNGSVKASGKTGSATTADNVVAPGTSKETTLSFKYNEHSTLGITAPEVKYSLATEVKVTGISGSSDADTTDLDSNENFVWTIKAPGDETATEYQTFDAFTTGLKTKLSGDSSGTKTYEAGTIPSGLNSTSVYTIGWSWKYQTADDTTTDDNEMTEQDETDTAMGNATDLDDLAISIKITATQVD